MFTTRAPCVLWQHSIVSFFHRHFYWYANILWAEQLEMWLAELLAPSDVRVIAGASDALHQSERCPKVVTSASRMAAARHRTLTLTAPPDPDPHRHQRS